MTARITNAHLLTALTGVVEALVKIDARVGALETGQHSTPTLVAEITSAPSARAKASKKAAPKARPLTGAALAKHTAKVAADKGLTPAQVAERDQAKAARKAADAQAYKARKEALSPLNKALFAQGLTGEAWATRFTNKDALKAALLTLTKAQAQAALEALASK